MSLKTVSVACPTCRKSVLMTPANPERPFCSKRCKDLDFGAWATEEYKVESTHREEDEHWSEDH